MVDRSARDEVSRVLFLGADGSHFHQELPTGLSTTCLVWTDRDGKLVVRRCNKNLSRRQIETILIERGEFGVFRCRDAQGRVSCFEPRTLPSDAVTLMLDRFRKRAGFNVMTTNEVRSRYFQ